MTDDEVEVRWTLARMQSWCDGAEGYLWDAVVDARHLLASIEKTNSPALPLLREALAKLEAASDRLRGTGESIESFRAKKT